MNAARLLALYGRIAEAPDAVARLRRFVLDLAVRGKLVPQDAGDEPASELLKRIAEQRRIVAKVDELMALCDALDATLADATTARSRLLDATLAEALSPAEAHVLEPA